MEVLLVEDDEAVGSSLLRGLGQHSFHVRWVRSGREGVSAVEDSEPDVMLLDLGLPDVDGYDVCRAICARSEIPLIILTARSEEVDRVLGLELGADDYVVKPFGFRELVARIRAVTRRRRRLPGPHEHADSRRPAAGTGQAPSTGHGDAESCAAVGALVVDRRSHRVALNGRPIDLTPTEFSVLALLADHPDAVVCRQELLEGVWGHGWFGPSRTLDVHVAALRRKLGDPRLIATVRGIGFRLAPP